MRPLGEHLIIILFMKAQPAIIIMSELKTFFRNCPSCGWRFEIRLTSKKVVGEKTVSTHYERPSGLIPATAAGVILNPHLLEENVPLTIDEQEFHYSYKCKHCGHEWVETAEEERRVEN